MLHIRLKVAKHLVSLQKLSEPKTHDAIFPNPKAREPRPSHHQSLCIASPNIIHASFSFPQSQTPLKYASKLHRYQPSIMHHTMPLNSPGTI
jgi:hypothetical protein